MSLSTAQEDNGKIVLGSETNHQGQVDSNHGIDGYVNEVNLNEAQSPRANRLKDETTVMQSRPNNDALMSPPQK